MYGINSELYRENNILFGKMHLLTIMGLIILQYHSNLLTVFRLNLENKRIILISPMYVGGCGVGWGVEGV